MSKFAIEHIFGSQTVPLVPLPEPSNGTISNFGTPGSTTYTYYISAYNNSGETTVASVITTTGNASLSSTNFNRILWDKVWGAVGYNIYNSSGLLGFTSNLHFDDIGSVAEASQLPSINTTGYNPEYTSIGTLIKQSNGAIGPMDIAVARPMEQSTSISCSYPAVIPWSPTVDWVFLSETGAGNTRRITLYSFDRSTNAFTWRGFVTITFPPATAHTIRGFAMSYDIYSKGSVAVSGTGVTGTGSTWTTDRLSVGSRIGFGSTDPNQISTWYEISAIGSNTSITLTGSAGTLAANTPYCIEDLRAVITTTNATVANGGLFVAKGLRFENFTSGGTTINAATTVDNIRAVYWLADAASVTHQVAAGNALDDKENWQTQYVYCLEGTTPRVFVYNVRAALASLSSGKSTSALTLITGTQAVTGTVSQQNNGEVINANHGAGKGINCLYFVTTTRLYRASIDEITNTNAFWIDDCMVEIPPGGGVTYPTNSAFGYTEHLDFIDDFVIYTTGATAFRSYITDYNTTVAPFETILGIDSKLLGQSTANANAVHHPSINTSQLISWNEEGISYVLRQNASTTLNQLYAVPISACYTHTWESGKGQYVITPALPTPIGSVIHRVYFNSLLAYGGSDAYAVVPECVKIWYRMSGILDDTGQWTELEDTGEINGDLTGSEIQFRIAFKVCGMYQLPSKVYGVCVVYENIPDLPSHLQWHIGDTDDNNGIVGFIQDGTYGSVPNLKIYYYRADNNKLLFSQTSLVATYGVFQYWDGDSWESGLGSDTDGIRRRFSPSTGILTGVNVYCKVQVV